MLFCTASLFPTRGEAGREGTLGSEHKGHNRSPSSGDYEPFTDIKTH